MKTSTSKTLNTQQKIEDTTVKGKSNTQIAWEQFRKHNAAVIGGSILIIMYLMAIFAGFLAPYGINEYSRTPSYVFAGPTKIHWRDASTGQITRPFVYQTKSVRDPVTRQRIYEEQPDLGMYPIKFFAKREKASYKLFGVFETDRHLFTVDQPAQIFLWGTNKLGKDVFSRIMYGGQVSLSIGVLAVWISLFLGLLMGGLAGFYGGWVDDLIMRFIEVLDAIPGLFLLISLSALLRNPSNPIAQNFGLKMTSSQIFLMIVIVLGIVSWGGLARTIRSLLFSLREMDYAVAAKGLGASDTRIIWRHLLPSTMSYIIVSLTLAIPGFILAESGLSLIGLGPSPLDSASWGMLLSDAVSKGAALQFSPWLLIPGVPIFLSILCWNLLGDGLRDAFDPKKRS